MSIKKELFEVSKTFVERFTFSEKSFVQQNLWFMNFQLPFGAPPILPSFEEELKNLIECPEKLPIHQLDNVQCYWPRKYELQQLLNHDLAPIGTTIKFCRDPITGTIGDVHEINLPGVGKTSKNSMSMDRAPGPPCDGVRGWKNNSNWHVVSLWKNENI